MKSFQKIMPILIIMLILTLFACKPKEYSADFTAYYSMDDAVSSANLIITGKIINTTKNQKIMISKTSGLSFPYTVSDVEITNALYGEAKIGDVIKVKQLENETATKEAGYLKKGEHAILFLITYESTPASLINPSQGKIILEEEPLIITSDDPLLKLFGTVNRDTENTDELPSESLDSDQLQYKYESIIDSIKSSIGKVK